MLLAVAAAPLVAQGATSAEEGPTAEARAALEELRARPDWLFPAQACPADVMPDSYRDVEYLSEGCEPDLQRCLDDCKSDDANACYALALAVQKREEDDAAAEALFLRSCRLGIPSGCTNRAAGMTYPELETPDSLSCAVRTFEKTCELDDPWGCTMYAYHLTVGEGVSRDLDRAARALQKSCLYGEIDEACRFAKVVEGMIREARDKASSSP